MVSPNINGASEIEQVMTAARDALTDDMVARVAQTAADGMDLIDQVNRSGLKRALPALASLVDSGDLDRLVRLSRVYGAAEDALTDDMIGRLAGAVSDGLSTLDRFNRGGAGHLISMLERMQASGSLERLVEVLPRLAERLGQVEKLLIALEHAEADTAKGPQTRGGIAGILKLLGNAENQDALRHLINLGKALGSRTSAGK